MDDQKKFVFAKESKLADKAADLQLSATPWKIAIIDDEEQIHHVTKMVLKGFSFDNKEIIFLNAYNVEEGIQLFKQHSDIAVCLLDVVMETEHAGLELVERIRHELNNKHTRIILRTGQPGSAPEEEVICNYDINDYKEKVELTRPKLRTLLYSCLRSYRDIVSLDQTRKGLEQIIKATTHLYSLQFVEEFGKGILQQVSSILNFDNSAFYGIHSVFAAHGEIIDGNYNINVIAGIGQYKNKVGINISEVIPVEQLKLIEQENEAFYSFHSNDAYLACHQDKDMTKKMLYFTGINQDDALQLKLLDIYSRNVLVAFQNIFLKMADEESQREIVYMLGEAVESRSNETGFHLKRVAHISSLLAKKLNLSNKQIALIVQASPLHDLGKIGIPDSILHKPGKLNPEEWDVMKTHVNIGYDMMKNSHKKIFQVAALIALEHHERWDGKGYPNNKKGTVISIEGRIVAIADVLDALASKRCYKTPWKIETVFQYLEDNAGTQFDPHMIELLLEEKEVIKIIYNDFKQ